MTWHFEDHVFLIVPKGKVMCRHGKTGGSSQVNRVADQMGCRLKRFILSRLKTSSGQLGCESGRVGPYFSHDFFFFFFFFKKTTYICHLESHATNYLMQNALL